MGTSSPGRTSSSGTTTMLTDDLTFIGTVPCMSSSATETETSFLPNGVSDAMGYVRLNDPVSPDTVRPPGSAVTTALGIGWLPSITEPRSVAVSPLATSSVGSTESQGTPTVMEWFLNEGASRSVPSNPNAMFTVLGVTQLRELWLGMG